MDSLRNRYVTTTPDTSSSREDHVDSMPAKTLDDADDWLSVIDTML